MFTIEINSLSEKNKFNFTETIYGLRKLQKIFWTQKNVYFFFAKKSVLRKKVSKRGKISRYFIRS